MIVAPTAYHHVGGVMVTVLSSIVVDSIDSIPGTVKKKIDYTNSLQHTHHFRKRANTFWLVIRTM